MLSFMCEHVCLCVFKWGWGLSAVSQEDPEEKTSFLQSLKSGGSVEQPNYPPQSHQSCAEFCLEWFSCSQNHPSPSATARPA